MKRFILQQSTALLFLAGGFFILLAGTAVFAGSYCSFDYSSGIGVGRCEQYLPSPYNPWKNLSSSDKQLKQESSSASWTWPTSSSGKQGTRYCNNGICAPFFPRVIETTVQTGTKAHTDVVPNYYTSWADVNVAIKGKPARSEWGTIVRGDGRVPQNWNSEYWNYYYYPQNYKYSNTYPCGFWSGYASTSGPTPYYKKGQYVIQTLSVTQNMPDKYNFHTEYLHLARGLMLCVLRTFTDTGAYQDNWVWLTPQWPPAASVDSLTVNQQQTAWLSPGDSALLGWTTSNTTQVDVSSSQGDIPSDVIDASKYNYGGSISGLTPHKDTTYTVSASNSGGSGSKSVDVKINKPVIWGLTANGIRKKIIIFVGQEVRLDWATNSAEQIRINGLDDTTNNKIKTFQSGNVTGLKPLATTTYTLRAWNQQWGFGDEESVQVEVQYIDLPKAAHCGFDSLLKGATTGVTLGFQWGAVGAFVGSIVPGLGTAIGAIGGLVGGIIAGAFVTVINFAACYFFDTTIGPDVWAAIQGGIIKGGLAVQGTPTFTPPTPPTSWTPPSCPTCSVTKVDVPPPPTIKTIPPGGWALVYDGGADPTSNALQKRNAEIGAWKYGTEEVPTLDALKSQGIQYVKIAGSLPSHETVQEIRGFCGREISCLTNRMNATLGYSGGDASGQLDTRKKWTDADVKKIFGIP